MNRAILLVLAGSSLFGLSGMARAETARQTLEAASQCVQIDARLERLACFDRVFETPVQVAMPTVQSHLPPSWQRAMQAVQNSNENWTLTTEGEGKGSNAWVTLTAINQKTRFADNAKPVLMLSCIDNLSRVELALPSGVSDARIEISAAGVDSQYMRSDDSGTLMSSARGMPAISMMKSMAGQSRLLLRSNAPFADGLQFDTEPLKHALGALRERCGW